MNDQSKTKEQLIEELRSLRSRLEKVNEEPIAGQAEKEKSRASFLELIENNPDAVIVIDENQNISYANVYAEEIFGRPRHELTGEFFGIAISEGFSTEIELVSKDKNKRFGEMRVVELEWEGQPAKLVMIRDVTRRRMAEEAIKAERDKAQSYLDIAGVILLVLDRNGDIELINRKGCAVLGRKEEELLHVNWIENFIPDYNLKKVREIYRRLVDGGTAGVEYVESEIISSGGEERLIAWNNRPIINYRGEIAGTLSSGEDITERRAAENDRERALLQLRKKAAETGAFLSSANSILKDNDFPTTARHIFNCCTKLCGARSGYVALLSEDGAENELLFLESGGLPCSVDPELPMPVRGLRSEAYKSGRAVYENEFMNSKWIEFMPEGHVELQNAMFAPLNIDGKPVGIMGLANKAGGFTDEDALLATSFADLAAIALHKSRTTEALNNERRLLNFAIEQMPVPVIVAEAPDGKISKFNQGAYGLLAAPDVEVESASLKEHLLFWPAFHPDGTPYTIEELPLALAIKGGKTTRNQEMIIRQGDRERWISVNAAPLLDNHGNIIAGIEIFPEITDLKMAEMALVENERILTATGKMAMIGGWEHDLQTGEAYWTRGIYDILEVPYGQGSQGVGVKRDFHPPEDAELLQKAFNQCINNGTPFDIEIRMYTSTKKLLWCRVQGEPVLKEGSCVKMRGTMQDVTARKENEEEKSRLEEQYHQAQKVESIGRLAGGVAHDLNNLLSPILGYAELLKDDAGLDEGRKESIGEIHKAGLRARDLVRRLLAFSRKQTLEYHPLDMNRVIANFEKLLRRAIREDIEIKVITSPGIPFVMADVGQIEQVIMNLSINAQDAMPEGGRLTINIKPARMDSAFVACHQGSKPGNYVLISFIDNGCGMDEEISSQIFEPFFTTKGDKGTGLGLATVYGIVKQHGGNIWVTSSPGQGAVFDVYLPVSEEIASQEKPGRKTTKNLEGSETILLVEDEPQVRQLARAILDRQGYRIVEAGNGQEALEILEAKEPGPVNLLLTDVIMPEMNGKDLFSRASVINPGLKVLYMSGYTDDVIGDHNVLESGTGFIQKPFSLKSLAAKVREILDQQ